MTELPEFRSFSKIPRLSRDCVITEKIDGTNAQLLITEDGQIFAGSRNKWLTQGKTSDNFGFAAWVEENKQELLKFGPGRHYGEWWGRGIQRGYGQTERHFTMFNRKWKDQGPACVSVVPVLYEGPFSTIVAEDILHGLFMNGSSLVHGFFPAEGIVIEHSCGYRFKKTLDNDDTPKSLAA